jgi:H+-transporting ATPase
LTTQKPTPTELPSGLASIEANRRLGEYGPNDVPEEIPSPWRVFATKFWSPIPWLLEAAIVLQISLGKDLEALLTAALLFFNATLGYVQERRAGASIAALKKHLAPTALARRDDKSTRLPAFQLVPGDALMLPLGALVPADARIVSGSILIDESMLSGESVPLDAEPGSDIHAGALVRRGQAIAGVTATSANTYFGHTARLVRIAQSQSTEHAAVFSVTRTLIR